MRLTQRLSFILLALLSINIYAQDPKPPSSEPEVKKEYYEDGSLKAERTYLQDQLHGLSMDYYETGEVKSKSIYAKSRLIFQNNFRRSGQLEYELKYDPENDLSGSKVETQIEYYPTGELHNKRILVNGKREGLEEEYYRNGQKKAQRNYKDGKKHGNAKGYHSNGNLQGDWEFVDGAPVAATIYYWSGEKWLVYNFVDGKLNGVTKEYDKSGEMIAKRIYKDDQLIERKRVISWW